MTRKPVKIAASRIGHNPAPADANPCSPSFSAEGVQRHMDANLERTFATYRMAGEAGADLAVSIENIHGFDMSVHLDNKNIYLDLTEELYGPTHEKISDISRKYGMYTASNYYIKERGLIYNVNILVGRKGEFLGLYRKIHMPPTERWYATPGAEPVVTETDIGVIGHAICYDMVFPEHCRSLAVLGADVIVNPTGGWGFNYGEVSLGKALLQVRAAENYAYLVNAYCMNRMRPGSSSCVIKNDGSVLAENASMTEDGVALAEFVPDYDIMREKNMYTFFSGVPSARARTLFERMPGTYGALTGPDPDALKRYARYTYARDDKTILNISKRYDQYKQDAFDGREQTLGYDW